MSSSGSSTTSSSSLPSTPSSLAGTVPPIQPGGSLLIAWQTRSKPVLVVGGGNVAAGRILSLLNADAIVHVCSPRHGLCPEVLHRINSGVVIYHPQTFHASLLEKIRPTLVLTAIDDAKASSEIYHLCHQHRIPVNVADVPPECDFYFGSVHRDGPLQVMVSTNGNGPKLANIVRRQIAESLPVNIGDAVTRVGQLRRKLRKVAPKAGDGTRRMEWMSKVCEDWTLAELCKMGEAEMDVLLRGYVEGRVPSFEEVVGPAEEEEEEEEAGVKEGPDEDGVFREALDMVGWSI